MNSEQSVKNETKMVCSCCGKEIKVGEKFYAIKGLIYRCCSKACLLDCYTPYSVGINTGNAEE